MYGVDIHTWKKLSSKMNHQIFSFLSKRWHIILYSVHIVEANKEFNICKHRTWMNRSVKSLHIANF